MAESSTWNRGSFGSEDARAIATRTSQATAAAAFIPALGAAPLAADSTRGPAAELTGPAMELSAAVWSAAGGAA